VKSIVALAATVVVFAIVASADARSYDTRPYSHFAHKKCKTEACYRRHPSGWYTFPYHYGHRRP